MSEHSLPPSAECPLDWLHPTVRAMVEAVMAATGCPSSIACCAALTTLAACVQGHTRVVCDRSLRPKPLTLWWVCVAPPAAGKSTILDYFLGPLLRHEAQAGEDARRREQERKARQAVSRAQARRLSALPMPTSEQQLLLKKLSLDIETSEPVAEPSWIETDLNPSNYAKVLAEQQRARGVAAIAAIDTEDEFLANYLGRHQKHVQTGPINHAYEGEPIKQLRSSRVSDALCRSRIDAGYMTLGLILQSHWYEILRDHPDLTASGFLSRCIVSEAGRWVAPAVPSPIPDGVRRAWDVLVARLAAGPWPELVVLDDAAIAVISDTFAQEQRALDPDSVRSRAHHRVARLLGLMAVVESVSRETDADELADAGGLADALRVGGVARGRAHARTQMVKDLTSYINPTEPLSFSKPTLRPDEGPTRLLTALAQASAMSATAARSGGITTLRDLRRILTTRTFRPSDMQVKAWADTLVSWGYCEQVELSGRDRRCKSVRYEWHIDQGQLPWEPIRPDAIDLPAVAALPAEASAAISDAEWHAMAEKHRLLFQSAPGIKKPGSDPDPEDDGR